MACKKKKCKRKKRIKKIAKKAARKEMRRMQIKIMTTTIHRINEGPRSDGRCKHGLTEPTCSYCQGRPVSKYACSVGVAFIR